MNQPATQDQDEKSGKMWNDCAGFGAGTMIKHPLTVVSSNTGEADPSAARDTVQAQLLTVATSGTLLLVQMAFLERWSLQVTRGSAADRAFPKFGRCHLLQLPAATTTCLDI